MTAVVDGISWTILLGSGLPRLFGAVATTIGRTTRFVSGICPDTVSLAHEFWHVQNTSTGKYVFSFVFRTAYWKDQEIAANTFGAAHEADPVFVDIAKAVRLASPTSWPTVTISHTKGL